MAMPAQPRQKQKLLVLRELLLQNTDENHKLLGTQIIDMLAARGISAERKTLYDDIETLCLSGMDILIDKVGHSNAYYVASRHFQDEELLVLADAVASSKFLTVKKSNELIKKIQGLTSRYTAPQLRRAIYVANRVKTANEGIYYSINAIHQAIYNEKKITFYYFEYNIEKKKQLRHGGELYTVSPYYLIWENDNYYLVCFCEKHNTICRYRVDRMSDVSVSEADRKELSIDEEEFAKSMRATYNMYGGAEETIELEMENSLINVLIDRFGEKISITAVDGERFRAKLLVQISPTFWGWLLQFGSKARIISPEYVKDLALEKLSEISACYGKKP